MMSDWLKTAALCVFLLCVPATCGVVIVAEYGRTHLPRQQYAAPRDQDAENQEASTQVIPNIGAGPAGHPSESDAQRIERESRERSANEYWLTAYTGQLAKYTLGLAVIAVLQAFFFVWQLILMNRGVRDAKDAAQGAKDGAAATALVAAAAQSNLIASNLDGGAAPPNPIIGVGERSRQDHGYMISFTPPLSADDTARIDHGEFVLHAVGVIQYRDRLGTIRETGFCWKFDIFGREYLRPTGEDEYNYED
jgi:hypothetical protein